VLGADLSLVVVFFSLGPSSPAGGAELGPLAVSRAGVGVRVPELPVEVPVVVVVVVVLPDGRLPCWAATSAAVSQAMAASIAVAARSLFIVMSP
jgi:hypothetical protein